jgi:Uncharacterized protein family UPF0004
MKIGFLSLGCPKNLVDGEVMLGLARDAGHELTNDSADADVLVVNTCAFIDSAKEESIDAILEMAAHKRDGRCARLVVTGCLAERYRDELQREIPEIDAVLGTGEVPRILDAIGTAAVRPEAPSAEIGSPLTFYSMHPSSVLAGPHPRSLSLGDCAPRSGRRRFPREHLEIPHVPHGQVGAVSGLGNADEARANRRECDQRGIPASLPFSDRARPRSPVE